MDILIRIRDFLIWLIYRLPESLTFYILRIGILLVLLAVLLPCVWQYFSWRSTFTQSLVAFVILVFSLYLPVENFREVGEGFLAFSVIAALICIVFLPGWIPFWLARTPSQQARIKKIIKRVIWTLCALQLLIR